VGDKVSGSIHSDGGAAEVQENTFSDDRQQACIVTSWSAPGCDSARLSSGNIGDSSKDWHGRSARRWKFRSSFPIRVLILAWAARQVNVGYRHLLASARRTTAASFAMTIR